MIVNRLLVELNERGHTVVFACARQDASHEKLIAPLVRCLVTVESDAKKPRDRVLHEAVGQMCAEEDYDVAFFVGAPETFDLALSTGDVPRVMLAIDANVVRERRDWRRTRSPRPPLRFLSYRTIERLAFRYFDAVVCVGPEDTAAFADLCPGIEYLTIPLGTDPPVSIVGRGGRDDATVLFVGNMAYGPNVLAATELITKVMPAIRQTHPDARAVIVGPSVPKSLRVLESAHIDVTGFVDSVVPYYESATILVSAMEAGAGVRT